MGNLGALNFGRGQPLVGRKIVSKETEQQETAAERREKTKSG